MTISYPDAVDQMYKKINTVVNAGATAIVGSVPDIRYLGRDKNETPPVDEFYIEVNQVTATDKQSAFGVSKRLYTTTGTLYAKIYAPQQGQNNFRKGGRLADMLKKSFRDRVQGASVWYRNARVVEMIPERGFYRFNVTVDYTYDERQ